MKEQDRLDEEKQSRKMAKEHAMKEHVAHTDNPKGQHSGTGAIGGTAASTKDTSLPSHSERAKRPTVLLFAIPPLLVGALALSAVALHREPVVDASAYEMLEVPDVTSLQTRELPEEKGGTATLELSMPEAALKGNLKDGTYTGSALCGVGNDEDWAPYYVIVEIEVKGGKISALKDISGDTEGVIDSQYVYDAAENSLYLSRAIKGTGGRFSKGAQDQIEAFIESGDASGGVDTVSGSTYSVVSIVQAYNRAVAEAVAQSEQ